MGVPKHLNSAESWVAGTMVLLISCVYGFSIGPVVYNIVAEVPSTRTRAKSVVLARNAYNIIGVAFVNIVTYRQLNADSWNWG
jgi:SP family general alpha glucoside:H+ symporter-like MFS transporter